MKNVKYGKCVRCGRTYEAVPDLTTCECGGILDIVYDYDYIKTQLTREKLAARRDMTMLAIFLALAGFQVWTYLYSHRRFDYLVNGNVTDVYWFLFYVLELQNSLRRWRNIRRLRKRLMGGEPLDHHADYRTAHRRYVLTACLKPLLVAAMMVVLLAQLIFASLDYAARPLPESAPDFPAVRLAEVHSGLDGPNTVWGESRHAFQRQQVGG